MTPFTLHRWVYHEQANNEGDGNPVSLCVCLPLSVSHLSVSPGMQIRLGTSPTLTVAVHLLPSPLLQAFDLRPMPTQPMGVNRTQPFHRLAHSSLLARPWPGCQSAQWVSQETKMIIAAFALWGDSGVINPKLWVSFLMGTVCVWSKNEVDINSACMGWRDSITKRRLALKFGYLQG